MRVYESIKKRLWSINERLWLKSLRRKNNNMDFTLITNNCIGGVIYHNLGIQFNSPTINLYIAGEDYLNFVKDIHYYSLCEMEEVIDSSFPYPVGVLLPRDDHHKKIYVYFQHYKTFSQAKEKWEERFKRVNYNNIFFLWEFYDNLYDISLIKEFAELNLKKIVLLHKYIPDIDNSIVLNCYKNEKEVAKVFQTKGISGKRYLDAFDYVTFLNN